MSPQSLNDERGGQNLPPSLKVFYSYADEDINDLEQLRLQLGPLRGQHIIQEFYRGMLKPGESREKVKAYLKDAQLILLLISPHFLDEHYESVEVQEIIEYSHHPNAAGLPRVIPLLLRASSWQEVDWLAHLVPLPTTKEPVRQWENIDAAFLNIAQGIKRVIEDLRGAGTRQGSEEFSLPLPRRNLYFTGRDHILTRLRQNLMQRHPTALTQAQAISGLGGVGKTQIALEYAYRYNYRKFYRNVFWVNAETRTTLIKDYVKIAQGLGLVQQQMQDQRLMVRAVISWLEAKTHSKWLLILDNADDLDMVANFLPHEVSGHILLTTRAATVDQSIATTLDIEPMDRDEGMTLLLRRAGKLQAGQRLDEVGVADRVLAEKIAQDLLDGLPLALDQAGGYLNETGCGFDGYIQLFEQQQQRMQLLSRRGGGRKPDHPVAVVATFLLAFERVEKISQEAANLLRLCAFLAPDAIPETLLSASQWTLNAACEVLRRFSLIRRDQSTLTIAIHRLVQAVIIDHMDEPTRHYWGTRAVKRVAAAFPAPLEINTWNVCQKLLPHVQVCIRLITAYKLGASQLLDNAGWYLFQQARYREAEPLYLQALKIRERGPDPDHNPYLAQVLHHLGELHERLGRDPEAEEELRQALDIHERVLEPEDPAITASLNSLADVFRKQRKYPQAEALYQRALTINQRAVVTNNRKLGPDHLTTRQCLNHLATTNNNLATLYREQQKYEQAEQFYMQALKISTPLLGKKHPFTAQIYHDLAELYKEQGRLEDAEHWHQQALLIRQEKFGKKNSVTATSLHSLADVYARQSKRDEAERFYREALEIRQKDLGPESPDTAATMYGLAELYRGWNREREAEKHYYEALLIWEKTPGLASPLTFACLKAIADLYESQGKLPAAERLYRKALYDRYQVLRPDDPTTRENVHCLARLYRQQHKEPERAALYEQAFKQCTRQLGIDHPSTEHYWQRLLKLSTQLQYSDADIERLYEWAFEMRARSLRGDDLASADKFELNVQQLANLYDRQNKHEHLKSLYKRAADICNDRLGWNARLTQQYLQARWRISGTRSLIGPKPSREPQPTGSGERVEEDKAKLIPPAPELVEEMKKRDEQNLKEKLRKCYRELGVGDPATVQCRHDLAEFYEKYNELKEAEYVYKEALFRCDHDSKLGPEHPTTIECQNDLARCYWRHRKYDEAKLIIRDALDNCELMLETNSPSQEITPIVVHSLSNGALYYKWRGLREKAESLLQRALTLCEQILGDEHPETILIRQHHADLLDDETLRMLRL